MGRGVSSPQHDISEILSLSVNSAGMEREVPLNEVNDTTNITSKVKTISSKILSESQIEILGLGPKFTPVQKDLDWAKLQKYLDDGFRRMKLADFFHPDEDTRDEEEKRFYVKGGGWEPGENQVRPNLVAHNRLIQSIFDQWKQQTKVKSNLSHKQQEALKTLKDPTIEIALDDKSGTFVVSDIIDHRSAAMNDLTKQTNITEVTNEINKDDTIKHIEEEIERVLNVMIARNEIRAQTAEFIVHKALKHEVARFYIKWKTHKYEPTMTKFAHAAIRGIVSCSGTTDENACDFLDFILNPGMRNLPSHLEGTKDFLVWIEKLKAQYPELPPLFGFLTVDYAAMYPSIPDNLALPAVREYLDSRAEQKPSTEQTMELLAA